MLWINIIMDTLAGLAFAGEYPSPELLKATPKSKGEKILTKEMGTKILLSGAYMTAICLCYFKLPFFYEYFGGDYNESAYMTGFFALFVFSGVFNCFNARVNGMNLLRNLRKNPTFIFIIILIFAIQLLMIYSGSPIFACVPLSANELKIILLVSASVIPFDLLRKLICKLFFRR